MRPIILSSLIMKSLLFFFFRKGNVYSRESRQPWTGLWLWLVSESWYGNLGNLNTCVSFQEEHFREGCKFIGQNISHFQKTSLCTSVVWTEKGKWSMEKEFGSYQVPELSSVPLQKKGGERSMTLIISRYWPDFGHPVPSAVVGIQQQGEGTPVSLQTNWSPVIRLKDLGLFILALTSLR